MIVIASILPALLYVAAVYFMDSFGLVRARHLLGMLLCGLAAAIACFGIFACTGRFLSDETSDFLNPVVEEIVKALPLYLAARRKKIAFYSDSIIYGAAVGAGFSVLENMLYLLQDSAMGIGTALFRGIEVSLIHIGCSALVAVAIMFLVRQTERKRSQLSTSRKDTVVSVLILVAAVSLHLAHNAFHFNPISQTSAVLAVMTLLLVFTYRYDVLQIRRWIDRSMNKQLEIAYSIDKGRWEETPTGRYLLSVKDSFAPGTFDSILRYVQLNALLSIAAKSRIMLREAELDEPLSPDRKSEIRALYEEYCQLEKRLGRDVRMKLAPALKFYPADIKSLDDLLYECTVPRNPEDGTDV